MGTGRERTRIRELGERGNPTGDLTKPPAAVDAAGPRNRAEQPDRVRVLWMGEELVDGCLLGLPAGVHDDDVVGDVRDDAEIVGDQDDRRAETLAELAHQVEDPRLDGHVERGRGLVCDQDPRVAGERHRDHHPLAHPTRELMRVLVDAARRYGDVDEVEQLDRARPRLAPRETHVLAKHLPDLPADRERGIERRHRLLEDEGDLAPTDAP